MIPRPPVDPADGAAIDLAMSGPRILRMLQQAQPDDPAAIEQIRVLGVDLRPGRAYHLRYELKRCRSGGRRRNLGAHLRLEPGARAHAPSKPAAGLIEGRSLPLPALGSLLELLPLDRGLPGLRQACRLPWVAEGLAGSAVSPEGRPDIRRWRIESHRPGRRARLRYSLRTPNGADYVYGELRRPDQAERLARLSVALEQAGIAAPVMLEHLASTGLVLQSRMPGALVIDTGEGMDGAFFDALADLLRGLARLEQAGMAGLPLPGPALLLEQAANRACWLLPALSQQITAFSRQLHQSLSEVSPVRCAMHVDLRAQFLRLGPRGIALEDLDGIGLGALDWSAASLAADLSLRALEGAPEAAELRGAWLEAWRSSGPHREADLAAFEALCLLRRLGEPFARLDPDWPEGMARRLALVERGLPAPRPMRGRPAGGVPDRGQARLDADPGLPQLARLCDAERMGPRLRHSLREPGLALVGIETMRHKPGRRCLLRYHLLDAEGERTWLVGKTFASARGPRVHEIHRRIGASQAMGAAVHLPEALAYLPDLKLLLLSRLPGGPLAPRLLAGETAPARAMATALARLHGSGLELEREHGLERELALLDRRILALGQTHPALVRAMTPLRDALGRGLAPWKPYWRRLPVHRDCYHEQFLFGVEGLSALDFDDAAMSDPTLDAGNLLAHLALLARQRPDAADRVARARRAFESALQVSEIAYPPALLGLMECTSLLRLVTIHHAGEAGEALAWALLSTARAVLAPLQRQPTCQIGALYSGCQPKLGLSRPKQIRGGLSGPGGRAGLSGSSHPR